MEVQLAQPLTILTLFFCGLSWLQGQDTSGFEMDAWTFFETHCVECHDDVIKKGGLDLFSADPSMGSLSQVQLWTMIHDRVATGEMPPPEEPRPDAAAMAKLLEWIGPRLQVADREYREVVHRRLNREEYTNSINDLLGLELDLANRLPEDQKAGGFDNNGQALALSTQLFQQYLATAHEVIDAAITTSDRPKTETFTVDSLHEVQRYIDSKLYGYQDGRVIAYLTPRGRYEKISSRKQRTQTAGRYRFRWEAVAVNSETPLVFSVLASDFGKASEMRTLGYFEATTEPRQFEIEAVVGEKYAIQFIALNLPIYLKEPAAGNHPGIGYGPVEVTGPLVDQWPPESHRRLLGDVDPVTVTHEGMEEVLRHFMPKAFRRPVTEDEINRYLKLFASRLEAGRSPEESLRATVAAVLCSPHFLYLLESDSMFITDSELASRLSYGLWSSLPDQELLDLAGAGQLHEPSVLHAQVERMLKDERSERFIRNFTGQWLHLREIEETTPDRKLYPDFEELLQVSMVWESEAFFREVLTRDLDCRNFLDSDFAMLNQRLAEHYGIEGVSGLNLRPVSLPENSSRGGVLTQASVLKVTANGTTTSPVLRGAWVLENILGQTIPPPPPNTPGIEPDIRGATTVREQLDLHRSNESCNRCHQYIDPPGFALESFDPVGQYRDHYLRWVVSNAEKGWGRVSQGAEVDASGRLSSGETFNDIYGFKALLLDQSDAFQACLTEKLASYLLGREMGFSDRPKLREILEITKDEGNGLRSLIHNLTQHELFRQP